MALNTITQPNLQIYGYINCLISIYKTKTNYRKDVWYDFYSYIMLPLDSMYDMVSSVR